MDKLMVTMKEGVYNVRAGEKKDIPEALGLIRELAVYVQSGNAVAVTEEDMERDGFGNNPLYGFFVAETEEKQVVGLALYYYRYSTWKGKRMYLEDLVVTKEYRGNGLGRMLFDAVMKKGLETKCTGMMWQVVESNVNARQFYQEKYGALIEDHYYNCSLTRDQMIR